MDCDNDVQKEVLLFVRSNARFEFSYSHEASHGLRRLTEKLKLQADFGLAGPGVVVLNCLGRMA
jgi:hypothetical protein